MVANTQLRIPDSRLHKKILLAMRSHLRGEVSSLTDMALHVMHNRRAPRLPGMCRACREIWRQARARTLTEFIGGLIEQREDLLDKIEEALQRIEERTYGVCEACGTPIPEGWLLAVPYTTHRSVLVALRDLAWSDTRLLTAAAIHVATEPGGRQSLGTCQSCARLGQRARTRATTRFICGLVRRKQRLISRIDKAIRRLADGVYGVCARCKGPIDDGRLAAVPYTAICAPCNARQRLLALTVPELPEKKLPPECALERRYPSRMKRR